MATEIKKPWYKRPLVLVSIGTGFIGLSAFGLWVYKKTKGNTDNSDPASSRMASGDSGADDFDRAAGKQAPQLPAPSYAPASSYTPTSSGFPLKKGSNGPLVQKLQQAIIAAYGKNALPKYGADGGWGSETQKFFDGHPELKSVLDQATYNNYVAGNFSNSSSGSSSAPKNTYSGSVITELVKAALPSYVTDPYIKIGWALFDAAKAKNINSTIALLQKLNNVNDYSSASQGFQMRPYELPLRRYTLVTGLLDAFKDSEQNKNSIRDQLRRMGLIEHVKNSDPASYDSSWTLSGPGSDYRDVRTKSPAIITDGFNIRVAIPGNTLLGRWLSSGNGYTRFRTFDGRTMYVRTSATQLV